MMAINPAFTRRSISELRALSYDMIYTYDPSNLRGGHDKYQESMYLNILNPYIPPAEF